MKSIDYGQPKLQDVAGYASGSLVVQQLPCTFVHLHVPEGLDLDSTCPNRQCQKRLFFPFPSYVDPNYWFENSVFTVLLIFTLIFEVSFFFPQICEKKKKISRVAICCLTLLDLSAMCPSNLCSHQSNVSFSKTPQGATWMELVEGSRVKLMRYLWSTYVILWPVLK